ncbi:MAG: hypothetical protein JXA20_00720 [Spirochaetes bacterium]|nr:hypothetical protein [Spirochaetota bacterium]
MMKSESPPYVCTRISRVRYDSLAPVMFQFVQELRAQKARGLAAGIEETRFYKIAASLYDDLLHGDDDMRERQVRVTLTVEEARVLLTVQAMPGSDKGLKLREQRYELRGDTDQSGEDGPSIVAR